MSRLRKTIGWLLLSSMLAAPLVGQKPKDPFDKVVDPPKTSQPKKEPKQQPKAKRTDDYHYDRQYRHRGYLGIPYFHDDYFFGDIHFGSYLLRWRYPSASLPVIQTAFEVTPPIPYDKANVVYFRAPSPRNSYVQTTLIQTTDLRTTITAYHDNLGTKKSPDTWIHVEATTRTEALKEFHRRGFRKRTLDKQTAHSLYELIADEIATNILAPSSDHPQQPL